MERTSASHLRCWLVSSSPARLPSATVAKRASDTAEPRARATPLSCTSSTSSTYSFGDACSESRGRNAAIVPTYGPRTLASLPFEDEEIGSEYGEGFATFRPLAPLQMDVDFLNDRMQKKGLERVRLAIRPDEAYGAIFALENVIAETREARVRAWLRLGAAAGYPPPRDDPKVTQLLASAAASRCLEVLRWPQDDVSGLLQRLSSFYLEELHQVSSPVHGLSSWLQVLRRSGVPCAVACSLPRSDLLPLLDRLGVQRFFQAFVTSEDGMESVAQRLLSAAVKLDRQPCKCVVFEDDPRGVAAAHNCSMKAVALIGLHPAYELQQSDLTISSYKELSVMNLKRLFSNRGEGLEFMELQKEKETPQKSKRPRPSTTL